MGIIPEEDYLQLSGIQHFSFCRRQWALIHVEKQWAENVRTVEGKLLHERAHDPFFTEKRGDVIVTREMPVLSRAMGVSGQCDVVEFRRDEAHGVPLSGRSGRWVPCPIEYKRGRPKLSNADRFQLCAQALCLEEMLACDDIEKAYLYYGEIRRREPVELTETLRDTVKLMFGEMHHYYRRGYTPRVKPTKSCNACSMKDVCLPKLPKAERSVKDYISRYVADGNREHNA
ncbi:MAG: CRISPR-associated protein Cas4 [Coriobacteriales bacterium]|jgi:CRISPR-associated exonuclease Cas4|nr:CRISPR-associated protein Cas4 [Coriobacteriales bacterium]